MIEVQKIHPAEEPVHARFEERISYFEPEIQADLRIELVRLLGIALVLTPPPDADVTHDEILSWVHRRAWDVYRGGNNVLELPDDFAQAAREENEAHIARTQGAESRSHEELREMTIMKMARGLHRIQHKKETWQEVLLAERLDHVVRKVEADVQQLFGRRIGELRAELAAKNA